MDFLGKLIVSRDEATVGTITKQLGRCHYGCGTKLSVKWQDGSRTYPCSAGVELKAGTFKLR